MKSVQTPILPIPGQLCLPPPVHAIKAMAIYAEVGTNWHDDKQSATRFESVMERIEAALFYLTRCQWSFHRGDTHAFVSFCNDVEAIERKKLQVLEKYWEYERCRRYGRKLQQKYTRARRINEEKRRALA